MRTTQKKGDTALAQAISTFTKLGYDISLPLTESASYDLIVDYQSVLYRVQAKYTSTKDVDLRRVHSNSRGYVVKKSLENSYDWLYILNSEDEEFLIKECLHGRRSIKPSKNILLRKVLNTSQ